MSKTTKLNEASALTALPDSGHIVILDSSGKTCRISVDKLLAGIRDSIKVGGRNLLEGTNQGMKNWSWNTAGGYTRTGEDFLYSDGTRGAKLSISGAPSGSASHYICQYSVNTLKLDPNTDYVFSFEVTSSAATNINVRISQPTSQNGMTSVVTVAVPEGTSRVTMALKTNSMSNAQHDNQVLYITFSALPLTIRFRDLKLERGNVATDWSPAPEDLEFRGG